MFFYHIDVHIYTAGRSRMNCKTKTDFQRKKIESFFYDRSAPTAAGSRSAAHRNPTSVRRVAPPVHGGRRAGALASAACRRLRHHHRRAPSTVRHALSFTLYVHRSTVTAAITALARARARLLNRRAIAPPRVSVSGALSTLPP